MDEAPALDSGPFVPGHQLYLGDIGRMARPRFQPLIGRANRAPGSPSKSEPLCLWKVPPLEWHISPARTHSPTWAYPDGPRFDAIVPRLVSFAFPCSFLQILVKSGRDNARRSKATFCACYWREGKRRAK